jgi:hypothetical protein
VQTFYDIEKDKLLALISDRRLKRNELLGYFCDLEKKLTRDEVERLKLYCNITIDEEKIIADRLYGKPLERVKDETKMLVMDDEPMKLEEHNEINQE